MMNTTQSTASNTTEKTSSQPKITLVVAASLNNVIGVDNGLPWHLPSDLQFFKSQTLGHPIVMGRNTWISIGRALPGRTNVVISSASRETLALPESVLLFSDFTQALAALADTSEIMVIGGAMLYESVLPMADAVSLNRIQTTIEGGHAFFPNLPATEWKLTWEEQVPADEKNNFDQLRQRWERD
jgi:dihydrofolate reductase